MEQLKLKMNVPEISFVLKVLKCGKLLLHNILYEYGYFELDKCMCLSSLISL